MVGEVGQICLAWAKQTPLEQWMENMEHCWMMPRNLSPSLTKQALSMDVREQEGLLISATEMPPVTLPFLVLLAHRKETMVGMFPKVCIVHTIGDGGLEKRTKYRM